MVSYVEMGSRPALSTIKSLKGVAERVKGVAFTLDFWIMPSGNDAVGVTDIGMK